MIQAVQKIERGIKPRGRQDVQFVNYWLYFFLLAPVTLGIYNIYIWCKKIIRIDRFIMRKRDYYSGIALYTERYANDNGQNNEYRYDIEDLKKLVESFNTDYKEIKVLLSFILTCVTLGIWGLVVLYKVNKAWKELQAFEDQFDDKLSQLWTKLGLVKYPVSFTPDPSKERSFLIYLILTIVTFGIWGIVWDYKIYNDPNELYKEFHAAEDLILATVRKA